MMMMMMMKIIIDALLLHITTTTKPQPPPQPLLSPPSLFPFQGFLTWLNCVNVKWAKMVQSVFTAGKILALSLIIGAGLYHLATGHTQNYQNMFYNTNWSVTGISTAFYQGLFSFAGW